MTDEPLDRAWLVPNQKPYKIARLVRSFVKRKNPDVEFVAGGIASPFRGETTGKYADALKSAMRFGFGRPACSSAEADRSAPS